MTFGRIYYDCLRIFLGLSKNFMMSLRGIFDDFLRTFLGLSEDFARTI